MSEADPASLIEHARRCLREALERWKAADLRRVHETRDLLEQSVTHLKMAIDLLVSGTSIVTCDLQPKIASLRSDISSMIRLVDACSAFHRGLLLRGGGLTPAYDASGEIVTESENVPIPGVLG